MYCQLQPVEACGEGMNGPWDHYPLGEPQRLSVPNPMGSVQILLLPQDVQVGDIYLFVTVNFLFNSTTAY